MVDDEPYITDVLAAALRFEGFDIEVAPTGAQALSMALPGGFDIIVLDVMLPDLEGIEVCHQLRAAGTATPVLFLTARDTSGDKLAGLAVGDDYVTKPFSIDELVARIRAVLRRTMPDGSDADGRLRFADLVMDDETHEVWRAGELIDLTATEFNLLRYLLVNARRVVSKSEILNAVWDYDFEGDANIVETYISYLQKKIDRFEPPLVHTIRRVGYSLREPRPETPGPSAMRIRRRLIAIMIVLVALGLVAVDVVTYSSLHSYLYGRTDDQLGVAQDQVDASYLHAKSHGYALSAATVGRVVSPEVYVEILNSAGKPVLVRPSGSKLYQDPPPKLPAKLPVRPPFTRRELVRGSYRPDAASVNVPSMSTSGSQPDAQYRLQASALPGETLVVASRLDSVTATLNSLLHVELAVSAGVVVALLVMLTLLIRRGLRPLEDMTEEAGAIAAGDLTRRVQPTDEKSEIGRLRQRPERHAGPDRAGLRQAKEL